MLTEQRTPVSSLPLKKGLIILLHINAQYGQTHMVLTLKSTRSIPMFREKNGELGPQWYELNRQVNWQDGLKTVVQSGKRYLLDETEGRHRKRTDDANPDGMLFSRYQTETREVSAAETVEAPAGRCLR